MDLLMMLATMRVDMEVQTLIVIGCYRRSHSPRSTTLLRGLRREQWGTGETSSCSSAIVSSSFSKASLVMAKKKSAGVNKSQSIREYSKSHPSHKPKQIAEELGKKGISVSPQFVSTILSTSKKKPVRKPGRPKTRSSKTRSSKTRSSARVGRPAKQTRRSSSQDVSVESLLKVKQIVSEMGGIDDARTALTVLEKLMK